MMLRQTFHYFGIRAINGILSLVSIYALTRLLSAEQYGLYALGLAGINVTASILFQWINAGIARLFSAHPNSLDNFFLEVLWLFKVTTLIGLMLLLGWLIFRPADALSIETSSIIAFGALAMGIYNMHLQLHNARMQTFSYGILSTSRAAFTLIFAVSASFAGFGAIGALFGLALGSIMAVILFGYRRPRVDQLYESNNRIRAQIINYGAPLALTYAATMAIDVSDRLMIGWWYGAASVGGYSASYDLAQQTVGVVLSVFYLVAFPRITSAWEHGGIQAARKSSASLVRILFLAAATSAGIFIGLSYDIAHIMFGPDLRADAALVMPWIASAIAIGCLKGYLFDIALQLEKRTISLFRITLTMAVVNVMLNFILLPMLGILGSAIAAVSAFSLGAIISFSAGRSINLFPPLGKDIVKTIFSMIIMILLLRLVSGLWPPGNSSFLLLPVKVVFGVVVFALTAILVNTFGLRNSILLNLMRKKI